jgi:hypothetical protein
MCSKPRITPIRIIARRIRCLLRLGYLSVDVFVLRVQRRCLLSFKSEGGEIMTSILRGEDDVVLLDLARWDFLRDRVQLRRIFLKFLLPFLPALLNRRTEAIAMLILSLRLLRQHFVNR